MGQTSLLGPPAVDPPPWTKQQPCYCSTPSNGPAGRTRCRMALCATFGREHRWRPYTTCAARRHDRAAWAYKCVGGAGHLVAQFEEKPRLQANDVRLAAMG